MAAASPKRGPRGVLKDAIRDYLERKNEPATISEITEATKPLVGERPSSSYRSTLQDDRYFERVSRGVFRLRQG